MEAAQLRLVCRVSLLVRVGESTLGGHAKDARNPIASQQPADETDRNPARYPMSGSAALRDAFEPSQNSNL
jgi:hypothetical protein